jgi:hypothetical protein
VRTDNTRGKGQTKVARNNADKTTGETHDKMKTSREQAKEYKKEEKKKEKKKEREKDKGKRREEKRSSNSRTFDN